MTNATAAPSITGAASVVLPAQGDAPAADPHPFLRTRKSRKYMGLQDDLAVVATGRALSNAGLLSLGPRAGLFLAVGAIPFREEDIDPVLAASLDPEGGFDLRLFGAGGFQKAHPLLTFRCLPNMPAYHVSACFDVQGPYVVTYPSAGQFYVALDEAIHALAEETIDVAIVGGVAHQTNFLVRQHFARLEPPVDASRLDDAAGVIILESPASLSRRGARVRGRVEAIRLAYSPFDPFADADGLSELEERHFVDGVRVGRSSGPRSSRARSPTLWRRSRALPDPMPSRACGRTVWKVVTEFAARAPGCSRADDGRESRSLPSSRRGHRDGDCLSDRFEPEAADARAP
jgi:hypothetical protein